MTFINDDMINKLGKEFCEVLEVALQIREDRRKIYGDNFLYTTSKNLLTMAEEKINRFKGLKSDVHTDDDLVDAVNFLIFAVCMYNKEIKDGKDK